jgi:general secretion pathway protein H
MTLIEILVVIAIMGLALAMATVAFGSGSQTESVRATNQLASTLRFAFDKARVSGSHLRVVIDLDARKFTLQQGDEAMYLPATDRNGEILIVTEEDLEEQKRRDDQAAERYNQSIASSVLDRAATFNGEDPGADENYDPYAAVQRQVPRARTPLFDAFDNEGGLKGLGEPIQMPEDVKIAYVRTDSDPKPIVEGQAFLYFFPQGRTQLARIQIQDMEGNDGFTIEIQPLTGKVSILEGLQPLELPDDVLGGEDALGKRRQRRTFSR